MSQLFVMSDNKERPRLEGGEWEQEYEQLQQGFLAYQRYLIWQLTRPFVQALPTQEEKKHEPENP